MNLTVSEIAEKYRVTPQHVRKLLAAQTIKAERHSGIWFVNDRSAAAYFAKEHKTGPKPRKTG